MSKNPWLTDAATGATGATYEIHTVADFLLVPEARRRICLREFHSWMAIQDGMTDLICSVGDTIGTPVPREALRWRNEVFKWHDDGKAVIAVQMNECESDRTDPS
jgi:hypothetical protein